MEKELKEIQRDITLQIRRAKFAFPLFLTKTIGLYSIIAAVILFFIINLLKISFTYPYASFYTVPVSALLAYTFIYNSNIYRVDWRGQYVDLENKAKALKDKVEISNETRKRFERYQKKVLIAVRNERISIKELKEIKKIYFKLKQLSNYFEKDSKGIRRIREAIKAKEKAFALHEQSLKLKSKTTTDKVQKLKSDGDDLAKANNETVFPTAKNYKSEEIKDKEIPPEIIEAQEPPKSEKPVIKELIVRDPVVEKVQNKINITSLFRRNGK